MPRKKKAPANKAATAAISSTVQTSVIPKANVMAEKKEDAPAWAPHMLEKQAKANSILQQYCIPIKEKIEVMHTTWSCAAPLEYNPHTEGEEASRVLIELITYNLEEYASRDQEIQQCFQEIQEVQKIIFEKIKEVMEGESNTKFQVYCALTICELEASLLKMKMNQDLARILCLAGLPLRKHMLASKQEKNKPALFQMLSQFLQEIGCILVKIDTLCREMQNMLYRAQLRSVTEQISVELDMCLIKLRAQIATFHFEPVRGVQKKYMLEIQRLQEANAVFFPPEVQPASATVLPAFLESIFALPHPKEVLEKKQSVQGEANFNAGQKHAQKKLKERQKKCANLENGKLFLSKKEESSALEKIKATLSFSEKLEKNTKTIISCNPNYMASAFFGLLDIFGMYEVSALYQMEKKDSCTQEGFHALLNTALFFTRFFLNLGIKKLIDSAQDAVSETKEIHLKEYYWFLFQKRTDALSKIAEEREEAEEMYIALSKEWLAEQCVLNVELLQQASDMDAISMEEVEEEKAYVEPAYLKYHAPSCAYDAQEQDELKAILSKHSVYVDIFAFLQKEKYVEAKAYCAEALEKAISPQRKWDCHVVQSKIAYKEFKMTMQAAQKKPLIELPLEPLEAMHRAMMKSYDAACEVLKTCDQSMQKKKIAQAWEYHILQYMWQATSTFFGRASRVSKQLNHKKQVLEAHFLSRKLGRLQAQERLGPKWKQNKLLEELSEKAKQYAEWDAKMSSPEGKSFVSYMNGLKKRKDNLLQDLAVGGSFEKKEEMPQPVMIEKASSFVGSGLGFFEQPYDPEEVLRLMGWSFILPAHIKKIMTAFVREGGGCIALFGGALLHVLFPEEYPAPYDWDCVTNASRNNACERLIQSALVKLPKQSAHVSFLSTAQCVDVNALIEIGSHEALPSGEGDPPEDLAGLCAALVLHAQKYADFTVNAIYLICTAKEGFCVFDAAHNKILKTYADLKAISDLQHKIVRLVGPLTRIEEDPILILRALKMLLSKKYSLDPALGNHIQAYGEKALCDVMQNPVHAKKRAHILRYFKTELVPLLQNRELPAEENDPQGMRKILDLPTIQTLMQEEKICAVFIAPQRNALHQYAPALSV